MTYFRHRKVKDEGETENRFIRFPELTGRDDGSLLEAADPGDLAQLAGVGGGDRLGAVEDVRLSPDTVDIRQVEGHVRLAEQVDASLRKARTETHT